MNFLFIPVLVALALLVNNVDSLTIEEISEPCKKPFVTENFDATWEDQVGVNETTEFYFPFASKLDVFRLTQNLYKSTDFESITESQLVNSCITIKKVVSGSGLALTMFGYNGESFVKNLTSIASKIFRFGKAFPAGTEGKASISLSDNKSYVLFDLCHDDGKGSFVVLSQFKKMSELALNEVTAHLKALGFDEKLFVHLNYDNCTEQTEFPKPVKKLNDSEPQTLLYSLGQQQGQFIPQYLYK